MSTRTHAVICGLIIIIGVVAISFALSTRQSAPKSVQHQVYVEEKQPAPAEEQTPPPPAEAQKPDLTLRTNTAADAIFRAFRTSTSMCWDGASHTYFVYFNDLRPTEAEFGY